MTSTTVDVRSGSTRRRLRLAAALVAAVVAALYVAVFFVQLPHIDELDNPAPVYLVLALVYAVGAALLATIDKSVLHWLGAGVQAALIGLFLWLLVGLYANDEESFILDMAGLAIAVTACQVALLGLLPYLAVTTPRPPTGDAPRLPGAPPASA